LVSNKTQVNSEMTNLINSQPALIDGLRGQTAAKLRTDFGKMNSQGIHEPAPSFTMLSVIPPPDAELESPGDCSRAPNH
jgi:hypothetical protein